MNEGGIESRYKLVIQHYLAPSPLKKQKKKIIIIKKEQTT